MRWLRIDPEDEQLYESRRELLGGAKEYFLHDMSIVDTKSSALLTHVSVMIAVVAIFLQTNPPRQWQTMLTIELTLFSLVAVVLLWCVDIMGPPRRQIPSESSEEVTRIYRKEILKRRAIYQLSLRTVRFLTLALIATVLLKGFLG
jgi:hypothetical protein